MPVYPGAPWLPKFKGPDGDVKYPDWKEQMKGLLASQDFNDATKVDIVMGALTGEAKRQVNVLEATERDKADKIFTYLESLYGHKTPIPVLRSQFFSCTQQAGESVNAYILRLRELYCGLRRHNRDTAPSDAVLREQFLLGLCEGPLAQALRVYARRHPEEDFAAVRQEALLLDTEHGGTRSPEVTCHAVNPTPVSKPLQDADWKATLKKEIMEDVRSQMKGLTQELMKEIRPLLQSPGHTPSPPPPPQQQGRREWRHTPTNNGNDWDEQGRPICRRCRRSGHIARACRASQSDLN